MSAPFAAQEPGLFSIVRDGAYEAVDRALSVAGARARLLNSLNQSLLFYAVQRQDQALEVCRLLINVYGVSAEQVDKRGQTALHWLATTENVDCVDLLLEKRCQIDHIDGLLHQTPLFYAAHRSSASMVRQFLENRADASFKDRQGKTPLCWAARPDTCKELALHCALHGGACDNKQAIALSMDWHKQNKRCVSAKYLAACAEAWGLRGCLSWVTRQDGSEVSAYMTALARARDVQQLCALEDEFISDHRDILPTDTDVDLYEQIGLNPDSRVRQETIKSIAQASTQTGPVKHFTVSCHYLPENAKEIKGTARARTCETVGYVYFRVCQGLREEDEDADADKQRYPTRGKDKAAANVGHIVISHIKVSRHHQKRGVATLLLASALQQTETKCPHFKCKDLHLLVADRNWAAANLYRKLGFTASKKASEQRGWVSMKLPLDRSLGQLREKWLRLVWDRDVCRHEELPGWWVTSSLAELEPSFDPLLSSLVGMDKEIKTPGSRKRKLSSSASTVSEASTSVGSATSTPSVWSAFASGIP
mmetsp:Transcript_28721/g.89313  ORF Transcript_28721/g.89313 Transcript_28721/m.89313 type:complete len:537 (-) Transcript_28721:374-1984(-)